MMMVTKRRQGFGGEDKKINTNSGAILEEESGWFILERAEALKDIGFPPHYRGQ